MAEQHYGTVEAVKTYTGVTPERLGVAGDYSLDAQLESWLLDATDLINRNRNRDFREEEEIPRGIHNIAVRMVGNLVAHTQQRRANPVIRVDDYEVEVPETIMLTNAIKRELRNYPAKPRFSFAVMRRPAESSGGEV